MITYTEYTEYEECTGNTKDEFKEEMENGFIQDITCGTYNGVSDTIDYWEQSEENIKLEIIQYIHDTDFYNDFHNEFDYGGISDICTTEDDYVNLFCELNEVFLLNNHLYVDLN